MTQVKSICLHVRYGTGTWHMYMNSHTCMYVCTCTPVHLYWKSGGHPSSMNAIVRLLFKFRSFEKLSTTCTGTEKIKRKAQRNRHVSYRLPYLVWYQVHVLGTTTGIVSIPRVPRTTCHVFLRIFLKKMKINLLC